MPTRLGQRRVVVAPRGVSRVACRDSGAVRKLASGRRTRSSHHVVGTLGKMLLGRQPFETIREDVANPGHFHEYTLSELLSPDLSQGYGLNVGSLPSTSLRLGVVKRCTGVWLQFCHRDCELASPWSTLDRPNDGRIG
jgi:hypothetical protein